MFDAAAHSTPVYSTLFGEVSPPLQSWVTLVIAGAIQSIKHIADYRAKKKRKAAERREAAAEKNAEIARLQKLQSKQIPAVVSVPQGSGANVATNTNSPMPNLVPIAVTGAILVIGGLLIRRK